jgi:6-phosphogluconolactonase
MGARRGCDMLDAMTLVTEAWLYVGTQRSGPGTGISRARFDARTGTLSPFTVAIVTDDPAFLVFDARHDRLVACHSGTPGGVGAFGADPATGALTPLGRAESVGRGPSQLTIDHTSRFVLSANYGGGYVDVHALDANGIGARTAHVQHTGHGPDPARQTQPYVHCVRVSPDNRFALVADLGLDRVFVYRFDDGTGALAPHAPAFVSTAPASGPRHLTWHPNGRWVYLIEELRNTITTFAWDAERGVLDARQTVSTLPVEFTGGNTAAEILVREDGRVLYASNRGHDSLAIFAIDASRGTLSLVAHEPSRGRTPRYMAFGPTADWLFVSNVDSDGVAIFRVDAPSGRLTPHGDLHSTLRPHGLAWTPVRSAVRGLPSAGER